MAHSLKDPLLVKTKDAVETKLPEPLKDPVERIVVAGMKLLYSQQTHQSLVQPVYAKIKEGGFQPDAIANGMVNLLAILYKASKGGMKIEAAYPAGIILLCYVLDDLEQLYGFKPTQDLVKQIGTTMARQAAKAFGLIKGAAQPGAPSPTPSEPPGLANTAPPQGAM